MNGVINKIIHCFRITSSGCMEFRIEGDVKWLLNCDFYGHNISNMASTAENSEEVFLPCQSLN